MNSEEAKNLLDRYENGLCTEQEIAALQSWYEKLISESDLELNADKREYYRLRMLDEINLSISSPKRKAVWLWPPSAYRVRIGIAAAAAIVLAVGAGIFYFSYKPTIDPKLIAAKNDVDPGKQGATLTLASGKRIRLTDAANGELAKEAGVVVSKSADGQLTYEIKDSGSEENKINTLSTTNGETYRLRLPDGSLVWLNAASSITYSARLIENGKRSVSMTGEGYFEVAKDKAHPFVVSSRGQLVEVLGTHFDVNAYPDEPLVATTLLEGSVRVSAGEKSQVIAPGEQALKLADGFKVAKVNTDNIVDWKDGDFNLDKVDFRVAMRKIARWYDLELIYDKSVPQDLEFYGWVSRSSKLSSVLKLIENSGPVRFRVEGKKLYIYK